MAEIALKESNLESINIKNWVTKSNELIESTYKLSLQEQRILLVMASKVQPADETLKTYSFRALDFIEIVGNKKGTGFYSYLKEIVKGLQSKVLTIKKDGKERDYSWVITSIYEENEGYITLQFHPDLKDLFLELKEKFTTYQLENVVRLNSVYSIRIYELLKQYERVKKRQLTVDQLRSLLAIEPTKYKQYGHFKNKVLMVAKNEINKKTDITFDIKEIKTGRKITSIEFIISTNGSSAVQVLPGADADGGEEEGDYDLFELAERQDIADIKKRGLDMGLTLNEKLIKQWLTYSKSEVTKLMDKIKYNDDIENKIGYISTVLAKKEKEEETEPKDPVQMAVHQCIQALIPKQKTKRVETLPEFIVKDEVLKHLTSEFGETKAYGIWIKHKTHILAEVKTQRKSMQLA